MGLGVAVGVGVNVGLGVGVAVGRRVADGTGVSAGGDVGVGIGVEVEEEVDGTLVAGGTEQASATMATSMGSSIRKRDMGTPLNSEGWDNLPKHPHPSEPCKGARRCPSVNHRTGSLVGLHRDALAGKILLLFKR